MKSNKKISSICINTLELILCFLIILDCNTVYINAHNYQNIIKMIAVVVVAALIILLAYRLKISKEMIKKYIILLLILIFYFEIFSIFNVSQERIFSFGSRFLVFFPLMIICFYFYMKANNSYRLYYRISDIATILGAVSVILWSLCSVFNILHLNNSVYIDWGTYHSINGFYNLYYETQPIDFLGYYGYRNTGIFTEAPMFNLCLSIALLTELFLNDKINIKKVLILIISIITTFSASGYMIVIFGIVAKLFENNIFNNRILKILKIFLIISLGICAILASLYIFKDKMTTDSYSIRIGDYVTEFNIWRNNILMGNGYGNNELMASNSILVILADGGIWLFLIYLISIVKYSFYQKNRNLMFFGVGFLWLIIVTVFPYSMMLLMFLALGYAMLIFRREGI